MAHVDYDDEITPEQIARLNEMAAEAMRDGNWITVGNIEWPDDANKSLRYLLLENERLKTALREIVYKGKTTGYGRAALGHIASAALNGQEARNCDK